MRVQLKLTVLIMAAAIFFAACNSAKEEATAIDMDKLKTEIQAMEDAFAAGEKAKDVDAVAAYYADDATSYNRNEPPSVGMAAIKEKIARGFAKDSVGDYNVYKVVDLFAEGNSATEIGSWTTMNAAGEQKENGYYMSYFQKRDGKYKCVRDMSVTESPAKPAMQ
jgi:ketosteroid isomerase-like protein